MPENIIKVHGESCFTETAAGAGLQQNGVER